MDGDIGAVEINLKMSEYLQILNFYIKFTGGHFTHKKFHSFGIVLLLSIKNLQKSWKILLFWKNLYTFWRSEVPLKMNLQYQKKAFRIQNTTIFLSSICFSKHCFLSSFCFLHKVWHLVLKIYLLYMLTQANRLLYNLTIQHFFCSYARAVGYRWIARWLFGYMGWDNTRPLPACIYHNLRTRFPTANSTGYKTTQQREWTKRT